MVSMSCTPKHSSVSAFQTLVGVYPFLILSKVNTLCQTSTHPSLLGHRSYDDLTYCQLSLPQSQYWYQSYHSPVSVLMSHHFLPQPQSWRPLLAQPQSWRLFFPNLRVDACLFSQPQCWRISFIPNLRVDVHPLFPTSELMHTFYLQPQRWR